MQKGKIIKDKLGSILAPQGFQLTVIRQGGDNGLALRKKDGDIKVIFECQDLRRGSHGIIQARFESNIYRMSTEDLFSIMHGEAESFWWSYESEESWKACIEDIRTGLQQYGMEILKRLSTPTPEFLIRIEGHRQIWNQYPELLRLGNEKWNLEEKEVLEQLECLCKESRRKK